jgi:hypothetical protein
MRWWKVLGLAGMVGVTATGLPLVQAERRPRANPPAEIRDRLHQPAAEAVSRFAG